MLTIAAMGVAWFAAVMIYFMAGRDRRTRSYRKENYAAPGDFLRGGFLFDCKATSGSDRATHAG